MKIHHYYKHDESIAKYPNQSSSVGECDNEEWREPCSVCGDEFINMGQHWKSTQCEYPELSDKQEDMLRGMLMSDGTVQFGENNNLKITLTEYEFLEWFSDELDCICPSRYPTVHRTSEEAKENTVDYFGEEAVDMDSEYNEQYLLLTRSHPFLNEFDNWYVPEKRYPLDDLELTASMAKMWYCGDGSLHSHHSGERAEITCSNEQNRLDKVAYLIREQGFDVYLMSKGAIQITSGDTPRFLDWMGDPPPGFEYKWL